MAQEALQAGRERQLLENGEVHRWYRFVLSYPDHLVTQMLDVFGADTADTVLDPFCGTGTTLVECKKRGIASVGLEANPACAFASRVKTRWDIDPEALEQAAADLIQRLMPSHDSLTYSVQPLFSAAHPVDHIQAEAVRESSEARYLISSGMLERGWISEIPFYKTIVLLNEIKRIPVDQKTRDLLRLALAAITVESVANVSFGPEIYVSHDKDDVDVLGAFQRKVTDMVEDLRTTHRQGISAPALVLESDARDCGDELVRHGVDSVDYVITSPPYPTEKDYTRQTRLELILLGYVWDSKSLRRIKQTMVRSHSKGIYKSDQDGDLVADVPEVQAIADELREKAAEKTYGFAKQYPRIIEEYFGGMARHLLSLRSVLRSGGKCAYVVGDQRTYLQTYTPTGQILGILSERMGYRVADSITWRIRKGTTGSGEEIREEILVLEKA